jgi:hypothetical protein
MLADMAAAGDWYLVSCDWGVFLAGACVALAACSHADPSARADAGNPSGAVVPLPAAGTVLVCNSGYAHPSVCCEPSLYQSPQCVENSEAPFRPCGRWLTFPDPQTCCSLENGTQCMAPAPVNANGSAVECELPCGPGGFLPDDPEEDADGGWVNCADNASGGCVACCSGMVSQAGSNPTRASTVACSAIISSQGGPAICGGGACPTGWKVPSGGQFDVCCNTGAGECFSRATSIAPPPVMPTPTQSLLGNSQAVNVSVLTGVVAACASGTAHPNVCCSPMQLGSTCVEYPDQPFLACAPPAISIIYPDPRVCCPLDGNGACSPPPSTAQAGQNGCYEPCGPGGEYVASPDAGPDGQCCYGGGFPPLGAPSMPLDCPPNTCDGGACSTPQCGPCPNDWNTDLTAMGLSGFGTHPRDIADHELCCQINDAGTPLCFSQADWIVTPP